MELTIDDFTRLLPKELLQHAARTTVRECDEEKKGHFVAYVDEGAESFDVFLTLKENLVAAHGCDCGAPVPFCRHKTALLVHVAGGKKAKPALKAAKKSKAETLLEETDPASLRQWVLELLQKNKDIELAFVHRFSLEVHQYTPAEVEKLTLDAIKAVGKKRKTLDPTELKKLTELWNGIHAPLVKTYVAAADDESFFLNLHTAIDTCLAYHARLSTNSNKLVRYAEDLLLQTVEPVARMEQPEAWQKAVGYFAAHILEKGNSLRMHYVRHLRNIAFISTEHRRKELVEALAARYNSMQVEHIHEGPQFSHLLLEMLVNTGLFSGYASLLRPIRYDNAYNEKLIGQLADNGQWQLAIRYAKEQISNNSRDEYNMPYLELLKRVYVVQQNNEGLAEVLADLLPRTYNFDDYLFLYNRLQEEEERKKWRTQIMVRAKTASSNFNLKAADFVFRLLDHEGSHKKMIDNIIFSTPYQVLAQFFEPMYRADKAKLLLALLNKTDSWSMGLWYEAAEADRQYLPELQVLIAKHYTTDELAEAVHKMATGRALYVRNPLLELVKKQLQQQGY